MNCCNTFGKDIIGRDYNKLLRLVKNNNLTVLVNGWLSDIKDVDYPLLNYLICFYFGFLFYCNLFLLFVNK